MSQKKVEVSAILERIDYHCAMAITPDAKEIYAFDRENNIWLKAWHPVFTTLQYWNDRAYSNPNRRIYRGILTIKVADNG